MIFTLYTIINEMITRSTTKKSMELSLSTNLLQHDIETGLYKVNIDFDDSSNSCKNNKKSLGNGYYVYIYNYIHNNGKKFNKYVDSNIYYNNKFILKYIL